MLAGSVLAQMPEVPASAPGRALSAVEPAPPRSFSAQGNFNGVTSKLDDLQKLGVNVLWLMPIHPLGQEKKKGTDGSPYSVRDYYAVNPDYGNKEDLRRLIEEAHRRNMRVIIDMVLNHTSFDNVLMAHPDFYKHDAQGRITWPHDWTDVAALDYTNPRLRRFMTDMLLYWVKTFSLDGFRCDAAGEVPTDFWESARVELDRAHPGLLMLAEASKPELMQSAFNLDYSWPMMATLNRIFERGAPATSLPETLDQERHLYPKNALHMRMFDDHDEQRALARYGAPGALAAAALIFTLDGVPMIYNGMEVGDPTESAAPALFESLKVYWQAAEMRPQFLKLYTFLIDLRKTHPALEQGETEWVHNSDETHVISYIRRTAKEQFLVTINLSDTPFRGTVEVPSAGWEPVKLPSARRPEAPGSPVTSESSALPALSLEAFGTRIFLKH
jgi:cyclomaltodextrinase